MRPNVKVVGYCLIAGFQTLNVLMVDIYPGKAATVTAASNVTRCLLGAAASAAIVPMSEASAYLHGQIPSCA